MRENGEVATRWQSTAIPDSIQRVRCKYLSYAMLDPNVPPFFWRGEFRKYSRTRECVCVAPDKGSTQAGSGGGGAGGGGDGEGKGEDEDGAGVEEKVCTDFKGLHPIFSL